MESVTQPGEQARKAALMAAQNQILTLIQEDRPLAEMLAEICRIIEAQADGMLASIQLIDEAGEHILQGAAPSLPPAYCEVVHGLSIGPNVGSCGAAAYTGQPVIAGDLETHPNWAPFRDLVVGVHGLRACWSTPIKAYDGKVVATFAMYYRTPKLPSLAERKLIDFTAHLVTIAINRHRDRSSLGLD